MNRFALRDEPSAAQSECRIGGAILGAAAVVTIVLTNELSKNRKAWLTGLGAAAKDVVHDFAETP
jgi:hypothetical protein